MADRPEEKLEASFESPIGWIRIAAGPKGILSLDFVDSAPVRRGAVPPVLDKCHRQIDEYFSGRRRTFDLDLDLRGTAFQRRVWRELLKIPFGETSSYGRIAAALGPRGSARAVGGANHRNPVSIIVPCHRVLGADGSLTGYGGGLWRKKWLLEYERPKSLK